jgi:hypothetical protein
VPIEIGPQSRPCAAYPGRGQHSPAHDFVTISGIQIPK